MASSNEGLLAFEGAQGFGAETTGGRGGDVVTVTNLNDSGKGSLRWALEDLDGPRIVVFDVGGHIELKDQIVVNGDVTIAGQTAPGGITVSGGRLRIIEDNVIVRGLEIRPGDSKSGQDASERDGIAIGTAENKVENVIIDSNSISWSIDEGISVWGDVENVTISNNIIANALDDSIHDKGEHSMALLLGDGASRVSIYGNLLAHNNYRNPLIKEDSHEVEFVNNLIYNYGNSGFEIQGDSSAHVINNVYIKGEDSFGGAPIQFRNATNGSEYYVSGNIGETSGGNNYIKNGYVFKPQVTDVLKTKDVEESVLANAGANADDRSSIDQRIINDVKNDTGSIIDSQNEVGGFNRVESGHKALTDNDNDGIPNLYERLIGSNVNSADANKDADGDGVANIEEYINGLIEGFSSTSSVTQLDNGPQEASTSASASAEQAAAEKAAAEQAAAEKAAAEKAAAEKAAAEQAAAEKAAAEETSNATSKSSDKVVVEAEEMDIDQGFYVNRIGSASEGELLQASDSGLQKASIIFEGATGTYALSIDYFDESDGESELAVFVNDQQVASWTWDEKLGTHIANHNSLATKVIKGLELEAGDQIQLAGRSDGREPLRVDKLTFEADDSGTGTSSQTESASRSSEVIRVQAEDFELDGFREATLNFADGKQVIQAITEGPHSAEHEFEGQSGVYDIMIEYFDEADGESDLTLEVNGKAIDSWVWDENSSSNNARPDNLTSYVIENVALKKGDEIVLVGEDDGMEPLRIDAVEFTQIDFA